MHYRDCWVVFQVCPQEDTWLSASLSTNPAKSYSDFRDFWWFQLVSSPFVRFERTFSLVCPPIPLFAQLCQKSHRLSTWKSRMQQGNRVWKPYCLTENEFPVNSHKFWRSLCALYSAVLMQLAHMIPSQVCEEVSLISAKPCPVDSLYFMFKYASLRWLNISWWSWMYLSFFWNFRDFRFSTNNL